MNKAMKWFFGGACACVAMLAVPAISGVFYPDGATTMHFAFEGSPNGDRPIVRPPAFYRADDGFGFVDSPTLVGTSRGVTAPSYFRFDVNIPPGTYDVTVITGGTAAESITTVKAEGGAATSPELRVAPRQNAAGSFAAPQQSAAGSFTVTVKRGAAGDKSLAGDACLNLEFTGTNPSMMKLDIAPATARPATQPSNANGG